MRKVRISRTSIALNEPSNNNRFYLSTYFQVFLAPSLSRRVAIFNDLDHYVREFFPSNFPNIVVCPYTRSISFIILLFASLFFSSLRLSFKLDVDLILIGIQVNAGAAAKAKKKQFHIFFMMLAYIKIEVAAPERCQNEKHPSERLEIKSETMPRFQWNSARAPAKKIQ